MRMTADGERLSALLKRPPYWAVYLGLSALLFGLSCFLPVPEAMPAGSALKDPAAAMLDAVKSITTLVSALTTTLCAAAAAVSIKGKDWSTVWSRMDGLLVIGVLLSGAVSYYGLYLSGIAILEMVGAGMFGLESPRLSSAIAIQYYGLLTGYFLLGLVFARLMEGRRSDTRVA
jgi:hypothetical protein